MDTADEGCQIPFGAVQLKDRAVGFQGEKRGHRRAKSIFI